MRLLVDLIHRIAIRDLPLSLHSLNLSELLLMYLFNLISVIFL
jgi:hypothetical protein